MFSLADIDYQILIFKRAAELLDQRAEEVKGRLADLLECHANGLRESAASLEQMIQNAIEREAREAMR